MIAIESVDAEQVKYERIARGEYESCEEALNWIHGRMEYCDEGRGGASEWADVRDAADFGGRYAIRVQHEDHLAAALLELSIMAINDYRDYMESNQEDVSPAESEESEESEDPQ